MDPDEVVPEQFVSVANAVTETLNNLPAQVDRAEMLVVIARTYELWLQGNVDKTPRTPLGTMATEHESAETLTKMFREHWMAIMAA